MHGPFIILQKSMGQKTVSTVCEHKFRVSEKVWLLQKRAAKENRLFEADSILIMLIGFVLKQNLH